MQLKKDVVSDACVVLHRHLQKSAVKERLAEQFSKLFSHEEERRVLVALKSLLEEKWSFLDIGEGMRKHVTNHKLD